MKLWFDDIRPAPEGYCWVLSVNQGIFLYERGLRTGDPVTEVHLDFDSDNYYAYGGDYINFLYYLEERQRHGDETVSSIVFSFHSSNPIGIKVMREICLRHGWKIKE